MKTLKIWEESAKESFLCGMLCVAVGVLFLAVAVVPIIIGATGFDFDALVFTVITLIAFGFAIMFFVSYFQDKRSQKEVDESEEDEKRRFMALQNK